MRNFDSSVLASRSWDSEIIGLVAQIHEYKGRQELYLKQKPAEFDRLIEIAKALRLPMRLKASVRPIPACCSLSVIRQRPTIVTRKKSWVTVMY